MPSTIKLWNDLKKAPFGNRIFSTLICIKVPYFGTVLPTVVKLEPGYCEVTAPHWYGVRNHLKTFNAIASCNVSEIAMGMLAEATVPSTHRWIPKGLQITYLAQSKTKVTGIAKLDKIPEFGSEKFDIPVPITITDKNGVVIAKTIITIGVGPKK